MAQARKRMEIERRVVGSRSFVVVVGTGGKDMKVHGQSTVFAGR